jgi:hypothetical protein
MAAADLADPDTPRRDNFWRAALHICDAGCRLGERYATAAAQHAAAAADPAERDRFTGMAAACRQVPEHGAR